MNLMDEGGDEEYCCQFEGHEGWGPCRHDFERDAEQRAQEPPPSITPEPYTAESWFHAECRYEKLRAFDDMIAATRNAYTIKAQVEFNGGTWVPLDSFLCPDSGDKPHFHLTRSKQL